MPDANVTIHMTTQQLALWQAIDKSNEKFLQMERGLSGVELASRKSARAEAELEKAAKRVWDETRTPMERHMTKLGELNRLVEKGKLDQDTYGRAVKQSHDAMEAAGKVGVGAFGNVLGSIRGTITGVVSLGAAMGLAKRIFADYAADAAEASRKQDDASKGMGMLAQVADLDPNSPEGIRGLAKKADELYARGGAADRRQAALLVFGAKSASGMEFAELFADMYASQMIPDSAGMLVSARTIQASMGVEETGSLRDIVSKGMAASRVSPASTESTIAAAAKAGVGAKRLGISDEELLAGTAIVSEAMAKANGGQAPSAEEAGTAMRSLMKALNRMAGNKLPTDSEDVVEELQALGRGEESPSKRKPTFDFKGKSLAQMLQMIEAKGLSEAETMKLFGRLEGRSAAGVIVENLPRYQETLAETIRGPKEDVVGKRMQLYKQLPEVAGTRAKKIAQAGKELANKSQGTWEALSEAVMDDVWAGQQREGIGYAGRWLRRRGMAFKRTIHGPEDFVRGQMPNKFGMVREESKYVRPDTREAIEIKISEHLVEAATDLREAAGELREAVKGQPTLGSPTQDK